jgi:Uncharacterized protein conserved in bacteria
MGEVIVGRIYQHFKGNIYLVTGIGENAVTGYTEVEYIGLYGECTKYHRELQDFIAVTEVDGRIIENRPDNVTGQARRFVRIGLEYKCVLQRRLPSGVKETQI